MDDLLSNLKAVLRTTPLRWTALTQTFSEDLLRRRPLPGEWSALECLQHLIELDQILFPVRIKAIFAGEVFPHFDVKEHDPLVEENVSPSALAAEFEALRADNLRFVETLSESDFDRPGTHPRLGAVTLSNVLHQWGGHDLMHLVQAERALMQPYIEGSGVWQAFFADHIAK